MNISKIKDVEDYIDNWISDLEGNKLNDKFVLLLIGNSGIGKFNCVKRKFIEKNYFPHIINVNNYKDKKILRGLMENIINSKQSIITGQNTKHAILIDDLDGISINDRGSINEIINMISHITKRAKKQNINPLPVACISNQSYLKKKKDLIKLCNVCNITIKPKIQENLNLWILKNNIDINPEVRDYIISESQDDVHRLDNILRFILLDNKNEISLDYIMNLLKNIRQKTITKHLYDSCKYLLTEKCSIQESHTLFSQERTLLPLMIHENFKKYISTKDNYTKMLVSQSLSKSMIIETLLYNKNEWGLQNIYSFRSCFLPSYLINEYENENNKKSTKIDYTMLLNKTSLRHTYIHKYREKLMIKPNINTYFNRKNIIEIINNFTLEKELEYKEKYGWTLKDIDDLKKIL